MQEALRVAVILSARIRRFSPGSPALYFRSDSGLVYDSGVVAGFGPAWGTPERRLRNPGGGMILKMARLAVARGTGARARAILVLMESEPKL